MPPWQLAIDDDPPTPEPRSAIVQTGTAGLPEHLQDDPFVRYMMSPPAEDLKNLDALIEAGDLFGDDHQRELAALLEGRHPLQRSEPTAP